MINMAHAVGSMVNIRKGFLNQFSSLRAWKWCAGILCLTAWKLGVRSDEEAGVPSVCPPGEVTAHQLVAAEWETGFSEADGGCNSDRWGPSWPVQEITARGRGETALKRSQGRVDGGKKKVRCWDELEKRREKNDISWGPGGGRGLTRHFWNGALSGFKKAV